MAAGMELFQYGIALAQDRLDNPRDDITTQLMQAEVEDENGKHRLTTGELGSFFLLLVVAGNETTRNAISHGMRALTEHPDQRKLWIADFDARRRRRPSRRSCVGRRRSSTSGAPRRATSRSAASRSRPGRRS